MTKEEKQEILKIKNDLAMLFGGLQVCQKGLLKLYDEVIVLKEQIGSAIKTIDKQK